MRCNVLTHGYGGYTNGCRCEVCRAAKAEYQAERRAGSYLETAPMVQGITHGRFGYEERGCRCEVCVGARRARRREDNERRRRGGAA